MRSLSMVDTTQYKNTQETIIPYQSSSVENIFQSGNFKNSHAKLFMQKGNLVDKIPTAPDNIMPIKGASKTRIEARHKPNLIQYSKFSSKSSKSPNSYF